MFIASSQNMLKSTRRANNNVILLIIDLVFVATGQHSLK